MKNIIIILVWLPLLLQAQRKQGMGLTDSLLKELSKQEEDTNKVNLFLSIARNYFDKDPGESMRYGKLGLMLAEKLGYTVGAAYAYILIGNIYYIKDSPAEALKNDSIALKLFKEVNNEKGSGKCYLSIGTIYLKLDNLPEALKNYFAVLELKDQLDKTTIAKCYLNIGVVYNVMKNYPEALENFTASVNIANEIGDRNLVAVSLQNIADIYNLEGNTDPALKNALAAIKILKETNDEPGMATCYKDLGNIYTGRKNYSKALAYFNLAEKLLKEHGNNMALADVFGGIGFIFSEQKKYGAAIKYFNKAMLLGKKINSLSIIEAANQCLSDTYAQAGQYQKSLGAYKAYIAIRDSIFNEENIKKTVQAQMQYDFDKKEYVAKVAQAKKDALQKQRKNIFIYGTLSAFMALLIIGALLIRQYKLRADHQRIELEQKQLRAQMNPHFIFNCLNSIQHFVVANDVKNANKYLSGFALLMRQTLENSKEGVVTLRTEIGYLKNYLSLELMLFEDKFSYELNCAENIDLDSVEIPSMIIQPFVENAIRHGLCYLTDGQGLLKINFYLKKGFFFCEIDDNGIGRERAGKLKKNSGRNYESRGMELTRQRLALVSKSIGSDYEIGITDKKNADNVSEGTTITIKFPVNA